MASSSSAASIIVVAIVAAATAGGAGYYFGSQGAPAAPTQASPAAVTAAPAAGDVVAAKVNGDPIYKSQVDSFIADLPDQVRQMPESDLRPRVIDRMIDVKLADQKAAALKLDQDPAVQKRLASGSQQILAETYLERTARSQIDDPLLKAKYDELVGAKPSIPEVHARHILVKTEAEAKAIIKQLDGGADFEKLAKEKSTDPGSGDSGGDLGYFTKDKMVPEFADAAFKMDKGQYSKTPVQSQYGWHVIQVLDKRDQPKPTLDEVKPQLIAYLLQEQEKKVAADLRTTAKIERFNPDGTPVQEAPPAPPAAEGTSAAPAAPAAPTVQTQAAPAPAAPAPAPAAATPKAPAPAPANAPKAPATK